MGLTTVEKGDSIEHRLPLVLTRIADRRTLLGSFLRDSMRVEVDRTVQMEMDAMVVSIEAYALTEHLAPHSRTVAWLEPATWWDHLKETLLRKRTARSGRRWWHLQQRWLDHLYDRHYPRYERHERTVTLETDLIYPKADVGWRPQELGAHYGIQWWTDKGGPGVRG